MPEDFEIPIGPAVRRLFGPFEADIAGLYRAMFIDLGAWIAALSVWAPGARRILEVGCGEGAMTERLCVAYPDAAITAIDVTPRLGRLFRGDPARVKFIQAPVEDIARDHPAAFDLVILSDVLHHVPIPLRASLLQAIRAALAPQGVFVFKEWVRSATPIHWACEASDRYLTGDDVAYLSVAEVEALLAAEFGAAAIRQRQRIRPWSNNYAVRLQACG